MFCPSFTWQADLHGKFVPLRQTRRLAASIVCRSYDRSIDSPLRIAKIEQLDPRAIGEPVGLHLVTDRSAVAVALITKISQWGEKKKKSHGEKILRAISPAARKNGSFRRAQTSKLELLRLSREYRPSNALSFRHRSYAREWVVLWATSTEQIG